MFGIISILCLILPAVFAQEQAEHREFQYKSAIDPLTGRYNFAYDTGNDNDIAHSMHMQYQDDDSVVRGRYGYTDPRGKLRVVEYEAGPDGFKARGDVGPDTALHDNSPPAGTDTPVASYKESDYLLDPAPVQMAGWDPAASPISQGIGDNPQIVDLSNPGGSEVVYLSPFDRSLFPSVNDTTGNPLDVYAPGGLDENYPSVTYYSDETSNGKETENDDTRKDENQSEETQNSGSYSIDVNPDEIRAVAGNSPVRRSADSGTSEKLQEQQTSSQPIKVTAADGRRLFYRDSHSMEPHEHYYFRPTHDHDSETRHNHPTSTHNHNAVRRYYYPRQTHDHDSERRYYSPRQTHDHDAEQRYYRYRQTHDHDAERRYYYPRRTHYHDGRYYSNTHDHESDDWKIYQRVYRNGRVYYRDRHSNQLHAHNSEPYEHHVNHQHSDAHLYSGYRYRNTDYPATAKPEQLQYIPSDKYHDKSYYWTSS